MPYCACITHMLLISPFLEYIFIVSGLVNKLCYFEIQLLFATTRYSLIHEGMHSLGDGEIAIDPLKPSENLKLRGKASRNPGPCCPGCLASH